jgi:hypothetical protein
MIRVTDDHAARLKRMLPDRIRTAMADQVDAGAQSIVEHARHNINDGAISGAGHVPGPVGGYPNSDTHELEQALHKGETVDTGGEIRSRAVSSAPYAGYVELGTSRAGPRPYMQLATEEVRPAVVEGLGQRFVREVNG